MKAPVAKNDMYGEIRALIASARERVAVMVNAELTLLYWNVGKRINGEVLKNRRAEYGSRTIFKLSERLVAEFGPEWNAKQLRRMVQFANAFPDREIVASLIRQLSWTHILSLIPLDDQRNQEFAQK